MAGGIDRDDIRETVRSHYTAAALAMRERMDVAAGGDCCGEGCDCGDGGCGCCGCSGSSAATWGAAWYAAPSRVLAPDAAVLASLGCGNPTAVAELREGERVLDLGSGGGLDVILSAKRVGPGGKAYGLDMTEEMLALANENAREAGVDNVEFLRGYIEDVPLPAGTVDVIISNCVINLSADKGRVFSEMFRVLRPGGRLAVTDVVADIDRPEGTRLHADLWAACIAGALHRDAYRRSLEAVGFVDVRVEDTHQVADGFASAIIRARKSSAESQPEPARATTGSRRTTSAAVIDFDDLEDVRTSCCAG